MAELKYLVIHCTATPQGRKVTGNDIRAWHTNPVSKGGRGWKQVGYTDMFHLDGTVERLTRNNGDARVDPWEIPMEQKGTIPFPGTLCTLAAWPLTARLPKTPVLPAS